MADKFSLESLLTKDFNQCGEVLHGSVIEALKASSLEMITDLKSFGHSIIKKEEIWLLYCFFFLINHSEKASSWRQFTKTITSIS